MKNVIVAVIKLQRVPVGVKIDIAAIIPIFFFSTQKTAYEILTCDWSSDVCSSDLDDDDVTVTSVTSSSSSPELVTLTESDLNVLPS